MATRAHVEQAIGLGSVPLPDRLNFHHDIDESLSSGARSAKAAMASILHSAEGINRLRETADPLVTRASYLANVERGLAAFKDSSAATLERGATANATSLAEAEMRLKNTVGIKPSANSPEIRDRIYNMRPDQRQTELAKAFAEEDREVIGAIVGFHRLQHGCDPEMVAALFDQYQQKVAPAEYASVKAHKKYADYLAKCGPNLMVFIQRALKGTGGYAKQHDQTVAILASYDIEYKD